MRANSVLFSEEQQFRQPWLWIVFIVAIAPVPIITGYGVYRQIVQGEQWGNRPTSDAALIVIAIATTALVISLLALLWTARLVTVVRTDGLLVRFKPFHLSPKQIDLRQVESVESVTYSPLAQYGGWGIRYGRGGKAYNVAGNKGVRLRMSGGRRLLIGSQRPDELAAAIRQVRSSAKPEAQR
jgi:hypothetical protein